MSQRACVRERDLEALVTLAVEGDPPSDLVALPEAHGRRVPQLPVCLHQHPFTLLGARSRWTQGVRLRGLKVFVYGGLKVFVYVSFLLTCMRTPSAHTEAETGPARPSRSIESASESSTAGT